jgi:serine O-acetyltransferase
LNTSIGEGLYLGHHGPVVINQGAVIGANCNIAQNVTIGMENRGLRKGCPAIGDKVLIGAGAVVVGKVSIGDDVMIAPNAFVNCNVPSHTVVFGNPCILKHRDHATEGYIK